MTDLEHDLGPRLHDLADYLAKPGTAVPAAAAIARYRHRRRARAGLVAVAAAVALIAIGVPAGMAVLSAGRPAGGGTAHPGTPTPSPRWSYGSAGPAADAQAALEHAQLQATAALIAAQGPVRLTAPARWGGCPDAAGLTGALHTQFVYWQGALPGGQDGCQYVDAAGAAGTSLPQDRLAASIGFLRGTDVAQLERGVLESMAASGGPCAVADAAGAAASAELQRCSLPGEVRTYLEVPDAGGAGIWVLGVTVGDRYPGDGADALAAVTHAAQAAFGG